MNSATIYITKLILFIIVGIMVALQTSAQWSQQSKDSISRCTNKGHQQMMQQLGIISVRTGANGNDPKAFNTANDEKQKTGEKENSIKLYLCSMPHRGISSVAQASHRQYVPSGHFVGSKI